MRPQNEPPEWDAGLNPSEAFSRDLKAAFDPPAGVPAEVDRRMSVLARQRLAAATSVRQRRSRLVQRLVAAAAVGTAAAAVALLVWMGPSGSMMAPESSEPSAVAALPPGPADPVTILDAFALARELETRRRVDEKWDVDGNGIVDQRDVDALALRAVALNRRNSV